MPVHVETGPEYRRQEQQAQQNPGAEEIDERENRAGHAAGVPAGLDFKHLVEQDKRHAGNQIRQVDDEQVIGDRQKERRHKAEDVAEAGHPHGKAPLPVAALVPEMREKRLERICQYRQDDEKYDGQYEIERVAEKTVPRKI